MDELQVEWEQGFRRWRQIVTSVYTRGSDRVQQAAVDDEMVFVVNHKHVCRGR